MLRKITCYGPSVSLQFIDYIDLNYIKLSSINEGNWQQSFLKKEFPKRIQPSRKVCQYLNYQLDFLILFVCYTDTLYTLCVLFFLARDKITICMREI